MRRREELRELLNEIRSLRQYIGARYVPKFIDDPWTDLIEYENLSVVSVNGTSYISGQTVPVGTPISDRNYWHIYGASSGAIINLQNQIDNMNDGDVPGSLQNQINDNTSDITALTNKYDSYVAMPTYYGAVGDGITDDTQAFIDCFTNNDNVYIPDGKYKITNTIPIHSNMNIDGVGVIYNADENIDLLKGDTVSNVTIKGITIENATPTQTYTTRTGDITFIHSKSIIVDGIKFNTVNKSSAVLLDYVEDFEVINCIINDVAYCGILCYGHCYYGVIDNNVIDVGTYTINNNTYGIGLSCIEAGVGAAKAYECKYIIISNNVVRTDLAYWEGIDSHLGEHIEIVNNIVKGFYFGISVTRVNSTDSPKWFKIDGNVIEGNANIHTSRTLEYGINFAGNSADECNSSITNNDLNNFPIAGSCAIVADECNDLTIANNNFNRRIDTACIYLFKATRAIVKNNIANSIVGDFIKINTLLSTCQIFDNVLLNGRNFYVIVGTAGLQYLYRNGNRIENSYWMDSSNTPNITNFVPDELDSAPTASNYHYPKAVCRKKTPTSGQPQGWIANGTTWLAMANLT